MSELELTLAVDSSVRADARLALVAQGGRVVESRAQLSGMVALASAASELVSAAAGHLSQVVVARGPGSYIGVRAGMAMALGIAQGRGLPIHQVGSLEVVAATARTQPQDILVLVEAGRGGLYGQRFRANLGRAGSEGGCPRPPAMPWVATRAGRRPGTACSRCSRVRAPGWPQASLRCRQACP